MKREGNCSIKIVVWRKETGLASLERVRIVRCRDSVL